MNPSKLRGLARLAGQGFTLVTVVRAVRQARHDGDRLRMLDAVLNALAAATTVALLVREMRERGVTRGAPEQAVGGAVEEVAP